MPCSRPSPSLRLARVGLHLAGGALQVVLLFPFCPRQWRQALKRRWSRRLLRLLGIRVEPAAGGLPSFAAGLVVANHVSFVDILAINALMPSGFVAKSDVANWPLIGWLAARNETLFIARGSRKAAQRTREDMAVAFAAGRRLVIFPEGTTTLGDRVLPFHAALFQGAIDAAVPVAALAIEYRDHLGRASTAAAYVDDLSLLDCLRSILASGGLVVRVAAAAELLPPHADRGHLAHRAHQAVASRLAELRTAISP